MGLWSVRSCDWRIKGLYAHLRKKVEEGIDYFILYMGKGNLCFYILSMYLRVCVEKRKREIYMVELDLFAIVV